MPRNLGATAGDRPLQLASATVFRHIALFRWSEDVSPEIVTRIADELRTCAAALADVRAYTCGPDVAAAAGLARVEDRFDFGVVADFDDEEGWRRYDTDAEHTRVRTELIRPALAARVVVQLRA